MKGIRGKATGLENIPCKLLKIAADVVAPSLTCIFNQSLLTGIYPSDWKLAKATPIFKNGCKTDLNNYRPISVIPAVAKIFKKNYLWPTIHLSNRKWFIKQLPAWLSFFTQHAHCLVGDKQQLVCQCWQRSNQWCSFHWFKESFWHYRSRNHFAKTC